MFRVLFAFVMIGAVAKSCDKQTSVAYTPTPTYSSSSYDNSRDLLTREERAKANRGEFGREDSWKLMKRLYDIH